MVREDVLFYLSLAGIILTHIRPLINDKYIKYLGPLAGILDAITGNYRHAKNMGAK